MALKKVLAASCLLACSVIGQAQAADAFIVKDIRIEGLQRVTLGAALLSLPVRVGDTLDSNASANAVKRLYSSGNFDDVKLVRDGAPKAAPVWPRCSPAAPSRWCCPTPTLRPAAKPTRPPAPTPSRPLWPS